MKYLIVSDLHLKKNFEPNKYNHLVGLINDVDKVIINGDFWDGFYIKFDEFINSEWKRLFPLLKKKNTIYIYGNHDDKRYCNGQEKQFSDEQVQFYKIKNNANEYFITHGHQTSSLWDDYTFRENFPFLFDVILIIGSLLEPQLRKFSKGKYTQFVNNKMKREREVLGAKEKQILICGHSHCPENNSKNKYLNSGMFQMGFAEYIIIDEKGHNLKLEKY